METKKQQDEAKGKVLLGYYITKLLKVDENEAWKEYITRENPTDLHELVFLECLPNIDASEERKDVFHFFNQKELVDNFNSDLKQLMKNEKFFLNNIGLLISYYFFYYILEQTYQLLSEKRDPIAWIWVNTSDTICENFFEIPAGEYLIVSTSRQTKTVWPLIGAMKLKPYGNLAKKM